MKKTVNYLLILVIGFVGGLAGTLVAPLLHPTNQPNQVVETKKDNEQTTVSNVQYDNQNSTTTAVEKVQNAVVSVINYQKARDNGYRSILGSNETNDELAVAGEGSGVIYKKTDQFAYLVTNTHVIAGAEKIDIQLASGEKVEGELIGSDTYADIAVIKIAADKVKNVAEFANSDKIKVGETAIAIGSPLGSIYANTVTQGIVSSLSRTVTSKAEDGQTISTNAIQTDTAINPGNSGGPLINIQGQVIGITSSKITSSSNSAAGVAVEGMGFAIPANDAVNIINQLEKNGKVIRPALGIQMVNLSNLSTEQRKKAGLDSDTVKTGIVVVSTQQGLPADGQLKQYDVITKIDGEKVETTSDLQSALYKHTVGDTISITYSRNGKEKTIDIKLTHSTEDLSN
ncbi:PDZ domain-containing protein [Streptococcus sp. zg-86]|uniref:PDZ domain-containing protein n=2 Tax=Streptococcus TaxID=1301 RepID=A0A6I4R7V0_9STRE|nr:MULTISPECIES: trypsin-like peptidase domain-containing protein [unclassified Streptococcus]MTB63413.1 PDZ domain-containing protein [Streptococcus sp. zg-86]MTB89938.1 PDZ domain-containing protein [Streptococcus sp. zg-36]MWV55609.1 PDZ domain-containing protein [Streptococcus sp. zg-70]QTH47797.1 trypsin-like peptidase domain-containing protein [Streptococcus sp. zg-86]